MIGEERRKAGLPASPPSPTPLMTTIILVTICFAPPLVILGAVAFDCLKRVNQLEGEL